MSELKKELRIFLITDYEKEGEYLRERHQQGWKFINVVLPGIYFFERCAPEDVVYQLDYNQEGLAHKEEYVQMFQDCGWEYLMDFAGYSYFRKPKAQMKGSEEIFCDDDSRLEMLRRVFEGRMVPLLVILCCLIIPQAACLTQESRGDLVILAILYAFVLALYLYVFLTFGIQYHRLKKRAGK